MKFKFLEILKKFFRFSEKTEEKKLAIILSGGGFKCAYTAGFLKVLGEELIDINHFLIAASGSSGNATYYASGQRDFYRDIWIKEVSKDEMLSFKRKKVLNVDFLIDEVFRKKYPININALQNSKIQVFVPAICFETGEMRYFSSYDKSISWYEVLRAGKALPFFYNKKVKIGNLYYLDSMYSSSWQAHIEKARLEKATHFLIVDLSGRIKNSLGDKFFDYLTVKFSLSKSQKLYQKKIPIYRDFMKNSEKNIYITPKFTIGNLQNQKELLTKMYDAGVSETLQNKELFEFLKSLKS